MVSGFQDFEEFVAKQLANGHGLDGVPGREKRSGQAIEPVAEHLPRQSIAGARAGHEGTRVGSRFGRRGRNRDEFGRSRRRFPDDDHALDHPRWGRMGQHHAFARGEQREARGGGLPGVSSRPRRVHRGRDRPRYRMRSRSIPLRLGTSEPSAASISFISDSGEACSWDMAPPDVLSGPAGPLDTGGGRNCSRFRRSWQFVRRSGRPRRGPR